MTDPVRITLQGDRNLLEAFREVRQYVTRNPLRRAVREGAQLMLGLIQSLVRVRTGKLRENIRIRTRVTRETVRARITVNTVGKADSPRNAFYWRFLEKGWRSAAGRIFRFQFVQVAFEARQRQAAQKVVDVVDTAVKRAQRKAKRLGAI